MINPFREDVLTSFILIVALAGLVANVVGSAVSIKLLWENWLVLRFLKRNRINGLRKAQATQMLRDESRRFYYQFGTLIFGRIPTLVLDPERYSAVLNDLWLLTLIGSLFSLSLSVFFMEGSIATERLRRRLIEARDSEGIEEAHSN